MHIGFISTTQTVAVTDSASSITINAPADARRAYYLCGDTTFHLARNSGDATTSDMRVPSGQPIRIDVWGSDSLSVIKAEGADDGALWATLIE
jgi:hypothetical protein